MSMIEIVGKLGPVPERTSFDRMMTAREVVREQERRAAFAAWVAAGRPGAGKKKRIVNRARARRRR